LDEVSTSKHQEIQDFIINKCEGKSFDVIKELLERSDELKSMCNRFNESLDRFARENDRNEGQNNRLEGLLNEMTVSLASGRNQVNSKSKGSESSSNGFWSYLLGVVALILACYVDTGFLGVPQSPRGQSSK